jgi:hypothetical protein
LGSPMLDRSQEFRGLLRLMGASDLPEEVSTSPLLDRPAGARLRRGGGLVDGYACASDVVMSVMMAFPGIEDRGKRRAFH